MYNVNKNNTFLIYLNGEKILKLIEKLIVC